MIVGPVCCEVVAWAKGSWVPAASAALSLLLGTASVGERQLLCSSRCFLAGFAGPVAGVRWEPGAGPGGHSTTLPPPQNECKHNVAKPGMETPQAAMPLKVSSPQQVLGVFLGSPPPEVGYAAGQETSAAGEGAVQALPALPSSGSHLRGSAAAWQGRG